MAERQRPTARDAYRWFMPITLRWADADQYRHVNNTVSYAFFDTAVNTWLADAAGHDAGSTPWVGLVVETGCSYFAPITFPGIVTAGIACTATGRSSVTYEIGIFAGDDETTSSQGRFVHVYVDRETNRPIALPDKLANALATIRR